LAWEQIDVCLFVSRGVCLLVMFLQQVFAEIVREVAEHEVDVIGVVLWVVVLNQERWSLVR
jgi:hypothetical protein